jgi:hypothetical protein
VLEPTSVRSQNKAPARRNSCFWPRDVRNSRAPDTRTVYLRVNSNDIYELKLFSPCQDVTWGSSTVALRTRGSSQVCEGSGLNVEVVPTRTLSTSSSRRRCQVTSVRKLTPDESAALPRNARP